MMRDKGGGGDPETQAGIARSLRNSAADYYALSGWQPHSPGGRLDLEALPSRMLANMSPLNKSGLSTGSSVSRRSVLSPERVYPAGIESSLDRDSAAHDRGVLAAGYRGPADLLYNGEQAHPLSIPAYPGSKEEGAYLSLASAEGSGNPLYGRSVLESSLFNRSLTSLPNNPGLVPSYRSHIGTSGEDFVMDRSLDRKFLFGSNPTSSSLYPYNRILENYTQSAEHLSTGGKSNADSSSTDRTGSQFPNPLSSHIPFTTSSDYVGRNPPLYPFSHFGPGFAPENYSSYTSSLSHLSNYGQLSAPPPAHTRVSDGLTQRSSVVDGQSKQRSEGSVSKPFDATVSRDYTPPAHQWSPATLADSKRKDSALPFNSRSQNTTSSVSDKEKDLYEAPPLPFPKHEDALEELMDNQFVGINSQEKQMSAPNRSCNQTNTHTLPPVSVAWNETDLRYTQSGQVQSSSNNTQSAQFPQASAAPANTGGNGTSKKQAVEQAVTLVDSLKEKTDDLLSCPDPGSFLQKFRAAISSAKQSDNSSRPNSVSFSFPEQSHMYADSNGSGSDTEIEENFTFQTARVMDKKTGNKAKQKYVSVASGTDDQGGQRFPYTIMSKTKGNAFAKGIKSEVQVSGQGLKDAESLNTTENEDLLQYDSSTSEYDPSSPYNASDQKQKQKKKTKVATKSPTISASSVNKFEDGDMDWLSPQIKLTIKTERITDPQNLNKLGGQRKKRDKGQVNTGGKRGNKTCPLCLKTFSRADSLTCHMRVHTGDRPYHCDKCGATYKVSSHLRDHIRSKHSDDKPFECERCGKPFTYSTARRRHEKICGKELSERVEFKCAVCHKGFVTDKGFSKHQEKCGVVKVYGNAIKQEKTSKCDYCNKVFDSTPSLYRHQRFFCTKRHKGGQYCCGECGKTFSKHNLYMVHTRHHSGEKPFRCLKCHACFYNKHSLKQHMIQHEGNMKFNCSSCDRAFYMKWCLSLHMRKVHSGKNSYKCNKCTSYFTSGYQLSRHARLFHQQEKQFKFASSKQGISNNSWMQCHRSHARQSCRRASGRSLTHHACTICNKRFRMKDLRSHILSEHPGVRFSEAVAKQPSYCNLCYKVFSCQESFHVHKLQHSGRKPFYCRRCNVAFLLKAVFKLHQARHLGYKPHRCKHCRKLFHWHASLTKHLHTRHRDKEDSKRFICHKCGMDFAQQICLNVHLKRHHIAKPCVCAQCGKRFVDFRHLRLHMSTHNGPKRYPCEKCGAGFEHKYLLDDHIKRRHTEQPKQSWLCEECGKSLCRRDALQKHMALHDKYRNGEIPQVGRRRKSGSMSADAGSANPELFSVEGPRKRGRPKGWRKNAQFGPQNTSMNLPTTTFNPRNKADFKSAMTTSTHDLTRGDLVGTTPISNSSARLGASSPYGTHPNFGMRSSFGASVSVGTSSTFGDPGGVASSPSVDVHPSFGMSTSFGASSSTGASNYGSNATFNAASNFDASTNFGASSNFSGPPSFGTPPNFNMQQSQQQEQFNYPYHYNTYIDHNMPCPSGADQ